MNQKKDIIDAWIAVEQFSEGDIKSNDRKYKKIDFEKVSRLNTDKDSVSETKRDILDWKSYFLQEMDAFLEREKISEKNRDEAGIILYFGIFKFEEVIKIIREKYKIKDTEEELKSGEKFTLSLSFDKDLNLVQDKLFLTMAGFVRENQEIPINLIEEEDKWKSKLAESFEENALGSLFIDEAGQALPQSCVGSLFRSAKVMAVGDPSQIKPVLTLDSNMMNLIAQKYHVDESFISNSASTQSLIDATAQYGFEKEGEEWIGIPLWVHRRSNYPMFNISNQISYQNLMVQGKKEEDAYGKAFWYDVKGNALDKYVEAQGQKLKELIEQRLSQSPELKDHIYVITPFKNVANKLIEKLQAIDFVARDEKHRVTNIGTVHTFQGKEAKIVYFVLGADKNSEGAAAWAVSSF